MEEKKNKIVMVFEDTDECVVMDLKADVPFKTLEPQTSAEKYVVHVLSAISSVTAKVERVEMGEVDNEVEN